MKEERYNVPFTDFGQIYDYIIKLKPEWFTEKQRRAVVESPKNSQLQLPI